MIKSCFSFLIISIAAFIFAGCYNRETNVDKSHLLGYDYRLYQGSMAWELAKAVEDVAVRLVERLPHLDVGFLLLLEFG